MRVIIIVIDGFGIGQAPDASLYSDEGSNSFLNTYNIRRYNIPNLEKLGLLNIDGINLSSEHNIIGAYGKLKALSAGKDSITGHQEMMGIIVNKPLITFNKAIPEDIIGLIESEIGKKVICKLPISGVKAINDYGDEHIRTHKPIIYTSADSVIQVAAHTDIYDLDQIYSMCSKIRKILVGDRKVGRVIARPFSGNSKDGYKRTADRKDFSLNPVEQSYLEFIQRAGYRVVSVGKANSMFNDIGFDKKMPGRTNKEALKSIKEIISNDVKGLIFANLTDTDSVYGHVNNVQGYIDAIEDFDREIPEIISLMNNEDILLITSDHGNDPTTISTDHSREYVPLLIYGKIIKPNVNLGTLEGFDNVGKIALELFGVIPENIYKKIKR